MDSASNLPEGVLPDDSGGEGGLRLCELPEKSIFSGGGNLYMVLNKTCAVQVKYDSEKRAFVGYGTEIPFSEFPDVRVARWNSQNADEFQSVMQANTLKTMRQEILHRVGSFLGTLLEKGAFSIGAV